MMLSISLVSWYGTLNRKKESEIRSRQDVLNIVVSRYMDLETIEGQRGKFLPKATLNIQGRADRYAVPTDMSQILGA
jgi:hypothetical protein